MRKLAEPPSGLGQNLAAGFDPFGVYSSELGREAELAGATESDHNKNLAANIIGGTVGGGIAVPAAVSGGMGAAREFGAGRGGLGSRALAGIKGFGEGAAKPFKDLYHAGNVGQFINQASKADMPTAVPEGVLESGGRLLEQASVGDVARRGQEVGGEVYRGGKELYGQGRDLYKAVKDKDYLRAAGKFDDLSSNVNDPGLVQDLAAQAAVLGASGGAPVITPQMAQRLSEMAGKEVSTALAPIGLSAGIGATGAGLQYGKGRDAAQDFQERLGSDQAKRIQGLAQWRRVKQAANRDGAYL